MRSPGLPAALAASHDDTPPAAALRDGILPGGIGVAVLGKDVAYLCVLEVTYVKVQRLPHNLHVVHAVDIPSGELLDGGIVQV